MARRCREFAGPADGGRNINARVAVEEVGSLELEANVLNGHDWEVLDPRSVADAEAVPNYGVIASNGAILQTRGVARLLPNQAISTVNAGSRMQPQAVKFSSDRNQRRPSRVEKNQAQVSASSFCYKWWAMQTCFTHSDRPTPPEEPIV